MSTITNAELRIEAERLCDENDELRGRIAELESQLRCAGRKLGIAEADRDEAVDESLGLEGLAVDLRSRIAELESLVTDWESLARCNALDQLDGEGYGELERRMAALGLLEGGDA